MEKLVDGQKYTGFCYACDKEFSSDEKNEPDGVNQLEELCITCDCPNCGQCNIPLFLN